LLRRRFDFGVFLFVRCGGRLWRALEGLGLKRAAEKPGHGGEHSHHLELEGSAGLVELHFRALVGYGCIAAFGIDICVSRGGHRRPG